MSTPGWYPDPSGAPGRRYFDGLQWTQHQPTPPKRNGHTVWIAVGSVAALMLMVFVVWAVMNGGRSGSATQPSADTPALDQQATSGVARDGKFEFKVSDVTSAQTIGDNSFMETRAQGAFVIFTIQVTNIGKETQNFFAINQKLIDSNGRKYSTSTEADMTLNQVASLGQINPGNSVTVKIAFDVPADIKMRALELHDSAFSGGVKVPAGKTTVG